MGRKSAPVGTPGSLYSQRSDLSANRAPTAQFRGQTYGTGAGQQAVSAAGTQTPSVGAQPTAQSGPLVAGLQPGQHPVPNGVRAPGEFPPLDAPTDRPNEPLTAGLPFGPGANSIPQPFSPDPMAAAAALLSTIPASHQSPGVQAILNASKASVANASSPGIIQ